MSTIKLCYISLFRDFILESANLPDDNMIMTWLKITCSALAILPSATFANIDIELNKTEQQNKSCRVYLVIKNDSNFYFSAFKLDAILFNKDDIINKNVAINIAPLQQNKKIVKAFDVKNVQCKNMGSILVNKIMQCETDTDTNPDCMSLLELSSKNDIVITK